MLEGEINVEDGSVKFIDGREEAEKEVSEKRELEEKQSR
jgi:hypothetical protein